MNKYCLVFILVLLVSVSNTSFAQEKSFRVRNPFLTPEEEMNELGIKIPKKKGMEMLSLKNLQLTAIIYGEKKIAIINSEFYVKGDSIANFTVKEIKPLSVVLDFDKREFELKLPHILAVKESKSGVDQTKTPEVEAESRTKKVDSDAEAWREGVIEKLLGITE